MKPISLVNILAANIRRINPTVNRSESMRMAWATIKADASAKLVEFEKLDGTVCTRVVSMQWGKYYTPVGGASNVKPGQTLFADLAKVATGGRVIISTYKVLKVA